MAVGFKVKYYWYMVGYGDFLHSFFSNICYHLEGRRWGSKYPCLMRELYQGKLSRDRIQCAMKEINSIKYEFARIPPSKVVWDIDDLKKIPPWGDDICPSIKDLSTYFITSSGENLFFVLERALNQAKLLNEDLFIDSL